MNVIEQLSSCIQQNHPTATVELTSPLHKEGVWSLDVNLGDKSLAVEWSPTTGFGVSTVRADGYGEGPDEVFETLDGAEKRVSELLKDEEG